MKYKEILIIAIVLVILAAFLSAYFLTPKQITKDQAIQIARQTREAQAILARYPNATIKTDFLNPYEYLRELGIYPNGTIYVPTLSPETANYKEWRVWFEVKDKQISAIITVHTNGTVSSVSTTLGADCLVKKTC